MATFGQIGARVRTLNINSMLNEIFSAPNIQDWMVETIQDRLYLTGKTGDDIVLKTDKSINDPYSPRTMDIKSYLGERIQNVTLKSSGDFYESFKIVLMLDGFEISGDFIKDGDHIQDNFKKLFPSKRKFESSVMELTKSEIDLMVNNKVIPKLLEKIHEHLQVN